MKLDKEDWFNLIIIFLVLALLIVIIYSISIYRTDSFECLNNPKSYYEKQVNLSCNCLSLLPNSKYILNLNVTK